MDCNGAAPLWDVWSARSAGYVLRRDGRRRSRRRGRVQRPGTCPAATCGPRRRSRRRLELHNVAQHRVSGARGCPGVAFPADRRPRDAAHDEPAATRAFLIASCAQLLSHRTGPHSSTLHVNDHCEPAGTTILDIFVRRMVRMWQWTSHLPGCRALGAGLTVGHHPPNIIR
jgi:hypothetical protein